MSAYQKFVQVIQLCLEEFSIVGERVLVLLVRLERAFSNLTGCVSCTAALLLSR